MMGANAECGRLRNQIWLGTGNIFFLFVKMDITVEKKAHVERIMIEII